MGHGTVTGKMGTALSRHRSAHHPRRMRALSRFGFGHTPLVRKLRHSRYAEKVHLLPGARPRSRPLSQTTTERWRMTWEQRFGALIELGGDEWDAAHERLEQEWLGAYTAAFVEIAVSRGWRRGDAEMWPVGIGDEAYSKPTATIGTRGGRLRKTCRLRRAPLTV